MEEIRSLATGFQSESGVQCSSENGVQCSKDPSHKAFRLSAKKCRICQAPLQDRCPGCGVLGSYSNRVKHQKRCHMVHMVPKQASSEKHELLDHHDDDHDDHDDDVVHCENFIIVAGNAIDGLRCFGSFGKRDDACSAASTFLSESPWTIVGLAKLDLTSGEACKKRRVGVMNSDE